MLNAGQPARSLCCDGDGGPAPADPLAPRLLPRSRPRRAVHRPDNSPTCAHMRHSNSEQSTAPATNKQAHSSTRKTAAMARSTWCLALAALVAASCIAAAAGAGFAIEQKSLHAAGPPFAKQRRAHCIGSRVYMGFVQGVAPCMAASNKACVAWCCVAPGATWWRPSLSLTWFNSCARVPVVRGTGTGRERCKCARLCVSMRSCQP